MTRNDPQQVRTLLLSLTSCMTRARYFKPITLSFLISKNELPPLVDFDRNSSDVSLLSYEFLFTLNLGLAQTFFSQWDIKTHKTSKQNTVSMRSAGLRGKVWGGGGREERPSRKRGPASSCPSQAQPLVTWELTAAACRSPGQTCARSKQNTHGYVKKVGHCWFKPLSFGAEKITGTHTNFPVLLLG